MTEHENLRASAGAGLIWGVGFTLFRDALQFVGMLIMIRLLSPEIYGQQALAQTVIALIAVGSLKTLARYPLQSRDPEKFDWDAHFTVGAVLNVIAFAITLVVGLIIRSYGASEMATAGLVVMVLSPIFIFEIMATTHVSWLETHHRWRRLRLLLFAGSLTATGLGVALALLGWGVFALVASNLAVAIPAVIDFLLFSEHRPRFSFSRIMDYTEGARFGANRFLSAVVDAGRALVTNSVMSVVFGFAALGSYSRAIGLAQLTAGRVGPVVMSTLFAVLTRTEAASERFNRFAALLFQGVTWVSLPAAAFLAVESHAVVRLLYGGQWESVVPLLPLASALLALGGVSATLYQAMLANLQTGACLKIDLAAAVTSLAALFALPFGVTIFLVARIASEALILIAIIVFAARGRAIRLEALVNLSIPALTATAVASLLLTIAPTVSTVTMYSSSLGLGTHAVAFALTYIVGLRLCAPRAMRAMLDALPLNAKARAGVLRLLGTPSTNQ